MRRLIGAGIVLAATLLTLPGAAQDRDAARRLFDEATRQFDSGNFSLALENFRQSRELLSGDERAQILILFNIARAQEELLEHRDALQSYQEYLDRAPSDAPYREQTLDRVRELRLRVSRGERGSASTGGLGPLDISGLVAVGVGAATLLAAIPTGLVALDGRAALDERCTQERVCTEDERSLISETGTLAIVTDVLWIAGLSVAAIGTTLLLVGRATEGPPLVNASAFCTEAGCIGTVHGRF